MGIIDFRVRPLWGGYRALADNGTVEKFLRAFRYEMTPSMVEKSVEGLLREMDEADVELAVVPGRQSENTFVSNEELVHLSERHPGRFAIFPLYNPLHPAESLKEIKDYVLHGPCRGVSIEPGFGNSLLFDSPEYEPLYAFMEQYSLPLLTTFSGSITRVFDMSLPERFHRVAKSYPNMALIAGHGGWPWFRELCCMAFFTPNIYLVPDLYSARCPGEEDVRATAEYMLRDKMLFGSSYPLFPVKAAVEHVRSWNLSEDSRRAVFRENAESILSRKMMRLGGEMEW